MKIALGQINTTVGDLAGNADRMLDAARRAAAAGADLIAFPELSITGYPPRDLVEKESFIERSELAMEKLALETADLPIALICGYVGKSPEGSGKRATNSAAILQRGQILFRQTKMLLPTYDVFDEARYFFPGDAPHLTSIDGRNLALTICEDAWNDKQFWERRLYQRDPVDELAKAGAQILISINASPYHMGKRTLRREIFAAAARHHRMPVVYVNQVGGDDSLVFDGSSFAMDAAGNLMASAASFEEDLVVWDTESAAGGFHETLADECEAVYEALVLGTRDYIRKCGFRKVLIGLSGGIDSSLTAAIAVEAVGKENVTGVAMPGPYSSDHSVRDAHEMAREMGIRCEQVSITET